MRNEKGLFIVGIHPVLEAIKSGKEINKVYLKRESHSDSFAELFQLIRDSQVPFQFVPIEKLNRMSKMNHQGVVAHLSLIEYKNLEEIIQQCFEEGRDPFVIVLDHITDVRNFGAIARTAECAGVDALIIPLKGSVSITPDAIKTSAGALNRLAVCREENLHRAVSYLQESGLFILAATEKAKDDYYTSELHGPVALIMGSEEIGIDHALLRLTDRMIKIPMAGKVGSLNVSVACGIIAFEIIRQRSLFI